MKSNKILMGIMVLISLSGGLFCADMMLAKSEQASIMADVIDSRSSSTVSGGENGRGLEWLSSITRVPEAYAEERPNISQQLIYNAELNLMVKNYEKAENEIKKQAETLNGYISENRSSKNNKGKLNGEIKLRVPSKSFRQAIKSLSSLGDVRSVREWTQDVTEEYMDVKTRIDNQKALEERLLNLLQTKEAKLGELVEVENKLADVRTKIEEYTGRMRYLQSQINYSTITITLFEPSSEMGDEESTLYPLRWAFSQIGNLFFVSIGAIVMAVVVALPWIVILYLIIKIFVVIRKRRKAKKETDPANKG